VSGSLLALAGAGPASAWERPVPLSDTMSSAPAIDRHGTIRVLQSTGRHRVEAGLLRWGKRGFLHCGVPGVKRNTAFLLSAWSSNDAGAMLFGWSAQAKHPRFRIASSVPGRCFRARTVSQAVVPKQARFFGILLAPLGTMLASWFRDNELGALLAAGPVGGKLRRRGKAEPPRPELGLTDSSIVAGDRLLWTWDGKQQLAGSGGRYRETVWGALGGRRGGPPGKARKLAQVVGHTDPGYADSGVTLAGTQYVADAGGGQVAGGFTRGGFRLMARRPGHAFGRARVFAASSLTPSGVVAAGNGRGDAVFAWESGYDDVYALVRRRSGKVVGPTLISPGSAPKYAARPSVGIDGAGRAMVAYVAQDADPSQLVRNQILVAICGRRRGFGSATSITGPPQAVNQYPQVVVNASGQAGVWFERDVELADGNFTHHYLLERARLRR
jgi:hypothetical protein